MIDFQYLVWVAVLSLLLGFVAYILSRIVFDLFIKRKMYFWAGAAFPVAIFGTYAVLDGLSTLSVIAIVLVSTTWSLMAGFVTNRILPSKY